MSVTRLWDFLLFVRGSSNAFFLGSDKESLPPAESQISTPEVLRITFRQMLEEIRRHQNTCSPMYLEAKVTECLSLFMRETEGKEPVNAKIVGFSDRDKQDHSTPQIKRLESRDSWER